MSSVVRIVIFAVFGVAAGGSGGAVAGQQAEQSGDIIVEGPNAVRRMQGGEWQLDLSRSYYFGAIDTNLDRMRPTGSSRTWRFCLPDTDIEPLLRSLVGEGRTESSGAMNCRPLKIRLGNGRLKADQTCTGSTMTSATSPSGFPTVTPARDVLTVTGRYAATLLTMDFSSRREPAVPDPASSGRPEGRRWSIKGSRIGDCQQRPIHPPGK
ncbi:hypothetical protein [Sphingomonas sp. Leaf343]|uniref:hypothetical protein n=1 Tax=Sphingomonas sp. Leaf343 TaxID=1736345 RepID=UPI0006FFE077|nr:hypothetical protein [Sphingomonas sp. Leaf343]KQR83984.1 hypothetical protein ASG07_05050 [Sphingomonas sp. Leaf343]